LQQLNFKKKKLYLDKDYKLKNDDKILKIEFAINKLNFFICDKCSQPFYGGLKNCIEDNNQNEDIIKKSRICLNCFDYTKIKGFTNCFVHGRENIQYKCKFCCSISSHFCWGTTHFCEECHLKQLKGDFLNKKLKTELNQCQGKDQCPLQIHHPENGEEYGLYCLLCLA